MLSKSVYFGAAGRSSIGRRGGGNENGAGTGTGTTNNKNNNTVVDKWRNKPLVYRLNERDGPEIISQVLEERNWVAYDELNDCDDNNDDRWNLWWSPSPVRQHKLSKPLKPWQFVNEIGALTGGGVVSRKDRLVRCIRSARSVYGQMYDFLPFAFVLPGDYVRFVLEYSSRSETGDNFWILKPADKSRGRGIFVFKLLSELSYSSATVVQKYITNPLLVSGYKFDLRIYLCVISLRPLTIYVYNDGLVRFATSRFDLKNIRNQFSHMTNTSINKFSPAYDEGKGLVGLGCKWTIRQLRRHFYNFRIADWPLWQRIAHILILTMLCEVRACACCPDSTGLNSTGFELLGFDVIVDDSLNPWLLEVNRHPSLCLDCEVDQLVKKPLLHDLIDLIGVEEAAPSGNNWRDGVSRCRSRWNDPPSRIGGFHRLFPLSTTRDRPSTQPAQAVTNVRSAVKKLRQLRQYVELTCRLAAERNSRWPLEDFEYQDIISSLITGKKDFSFWTPSR